MAETDNDPTVVPLAGVSLAGGRYLLERKVGQGGMGAVYEAKDQRLGRKVAVKLMLEKSAGFAQRFEREARAASRINHPNCIAVHDFGTEVHGSYLVLEWVEGRSLAGIVAEEGGLSPARASELMAQVCDGLFAANAAGVIHRDVKPDNVMVHLAPDGREVAKLVDFGIARVTDGSEPKLTQTGSFIGSPLYMSPEQALALELDPRSDVYSAGATLYFALAGRPPYTGEGSSVMMQVINADPPALPSPLDGIPIAAVVRRAMAKKREERYATAAELARAIHRANEADFAGRSPRRGPPLKVVAAISVPALALILGAAVLTATRTPSPPAALPVATRVADPQPPSAPAAAALPAATAAVEPPAPAPAPPVSVPSPAPSPPPEQVPGLADARKLVLAKRRDRALAALARLRKQYPGNAEIPSLQAQVDFDNLRWVDGIAAYRAAIALQPALRSDPAVIRHAIDCLGSDGYHRACEDFLRKDIGAPALPYLTEAAGSHQYESVRQRARRLAPQITR
ncbi:MAG TPA: serine/threonine-protein kinase [Myxococcaceae bacterium]|nr:serine/threonine-protein kinase [Myxococcaceae bacterium]